VSYEIKNLVFKHLYVFFFYIWSTIYLNKRIIIKFPPIMKTQKAESILNLENRFLTNKKNPKKLTEKFTDWFRNFLESSE
jgi:hypothetical protein